MNRLLPWLIAAAAAGLMAGCGGPKDKVATQTAAKVNKEEITVHQINAVLQQRGVAADQADKAGARVLEMLIDQELAVQKAQELKIDRDPRVVQALEAARRDIISRAYTERISQGASKPSKEEISKFYDDNPALFRERRLFQLTELAMEVPADQVQKVRSDLASARTAKDVIDYLNAGKIRHSVNPVVRASEQIPMALLPGISRLKEGEFVILPAPQGMAAYIVTGSKPQPVDLEKAEKAIELFLQNDRKRKVVADDLKALRAAATVSYSGKFAESAPGAAAAASAAAGDAPAAQGGLVLKGAPEPSASAGGTGQADGKPAAIDDSTVKKGLGLK